MSRLKETPSRGAAARIPDARDESIWYFDHSWVGAAGQMLALPLNFASEVGREVVV